MNAPVAQQVAFPETGTPFAGGIFCWKLFDAEGPYALIVAPREGDLKPMTHQAAEKKAVAYRGGKHDDWTLPNRAEALAMFEHLRDPLADTANAFEREWYWTSTPYADGPACAWIQSFLNGYQDFVHRGTHCRARAVRRVRI